MRYLDLTLRPRRKTWRWTKALLEEAEAAGRPTETLRFWEAGHPFVVLGRSSRLAAEVHGDACRSLGIPVLRRPSGGAAVVTGPGCLMYALVLSTGSGRPCAVSIARIRRSWARSVRLWPRWPPACAATAPATWCSAGGRYRATVCA